MTSSTQDVILHFKRLSERWSVVEEGVVMIILSILFILAVDAVIAIAVAFATAFIAEVGATALIAL